MHNIAHLPVVIQVLMGLLAFIVAMHVTKRDPVGYTVFVLATFILAAFKPTLLAVPLTLAFCTIVMLVTLCLRGDSKKA